MPQHHEDVALSAIVQDIDALNLFLLDHGRPEVGIEEDQGSAEVGRGDAEDGERVLVDLDDAANDVAIVLKMGVPVRPRDHQIRSAVRAVLIGDGEEAAEEGLNVHGLEVVSGDFVAPGLGWIFPGIEADGNEDVGGKSFEGAIAVAEVEIVGIRSCLILIAAALDGEEALRVRDIERLQDEGIEYAEDDGIGADGEREGEHGGDGESGRAAELADGKTNVGGDGFEGGPLPHCAAALFNHG